MIGVNDKSARKSKTALIGMMLVGIAALFVCGAVAGYAEASGASVDQTVVTGVVVVLGVVGMAAAFGIGTLWMRSIDEAAQEAHKSAWYWGGSAGLAVGGVGLILSMLPGAASWTLPGFLGRSDPAAWAAMGAVGLMTLMMLGYGIVWAWWWLARR